MQVLAHNLISQFTNNQLNITTNKKTKSTEKLSSGYKINRSADDAAGLQISEKMRSQIRGLNQASHNIQDGISLCQVADGALNESQSILQRMRELCVLAANGINSNEDRNSIQQEINQLIEETDRIANTTNFNEDIYPLSAKNSNITSNGVTWKLPSNIYEKTLTVTASSTTRNLFIDGVHISAGSSTKMTCLYSATDTALTFDWGSMANGAWNSMGDGEHYSLSLKDLKMDENGYVYYESHFSRYGTNKFYLCDTNIIDGTPVAPSASTIQQIQYFKGTQVNNANPNNDNAIWIQMGDKQNQGMYITLVDATAKGIGITDPSIDVTSSSSSIKSLSRLDSAIDKVSYYRSSFGAYQNRLEHGKLVDDNIAENLQASESRLRDTDIAEEAVRNSKATILEQVGVAILAQANQSTQNILSLLQ